MTKFYTIMIAKEYHRQMRHSDELKPDGHLDHGTHRARPDKKARERRHARYLGGVLSIMLVNYGKF